MAEAEKLSLEIKRFIRAPRDRVYAAWTDPAQLKKWFGPEKVETRNLIADVRVGGQFRWDLTNPEGKEITISGEYREVLARQEDRVHLEIRRGRRLEKPQQYRHRGIFRSRGRYGDPPDSRKTSKRNVTRRSHTRLEQCAR